MNGWRTTAIGCAVVVLLLIACLAIFQVPGIARFWLGAFVLLSMVPVGSVALLLVHGFTGGRWGGDLAPALVPAARSMPLLIILVLPILLFRASIYPWPTNEIPADVTRYYLNPWFFDVRTLLALAAWSALAWSGAWKRPLSAGLGLTLHLVLISFIPADWILTTEPGATSAAFGFGFGIEQIFAALAFAGVLGAQGPGARASRDLAGLLVTALLGIVYFVYVQFVITWYGNIPEHVAWYVYRTGGWADVALAAFVLGAALPMLAILNPAVRKSWRALRIVSALVLLGIALHIAWLIAPALGAPVLFAPLLALGVLLVSTMRAGLASAHGRI